MECRLSRESDCVSASCWKVCLQEELLSKMLLVELSSDEERLDSSSYEQVMPSDISRLWILADALEEVAVSTAVVGLLRGEDNRFHVFAMVASVLGLTAILRSSMKSWRRAGYIS